MWRIWIACIAFSLMAPSAIAQNLPQRVDELGDPFFLEVRGDETFSAKEIRSVLTSSLDVIVAAHRLELLDDYLKTLKSKCQRGYRHAGFAYAKVDIHFDKTRERIILKIDEGSRYACGDIVVTGNRHIAREAIIAELKKPRPKEEKEDNEKQEFDDPIWQPGEPASFLADRELVWRSPIQRIFADLGYHDAKFTYSVHAHEPTRSARLHLTITDEGRPAVVKDVDVTGLKKNTRAALLKHIAWKPGALISQAELARIERTLWKSGRFLTQSVALVEPSPLEDAYRLRIDVLEYEPLPRLDEPLTRAESVLLKSRDWFARFDQQECDIVCETEADGVRIEATMSPREGLLLTAFTRSGSRKEFKPTHALAASRNTIGYYAQNLGEKFAIERIPLTATLSISATGCAPEDPDDIPFRIGFGAGAKYDADIKLDSPLQLELKFDPVFFLGLAHRYEARTKFDGGTLIITSKRDTIHLDVETGRPLKYVRTKQDLRDGRGTLITREGAYAARWAEIQAATSATSNRYEAKRPLSSFLLFVSDPRVWKDLAQLFDMDVKDVKPEALASLKRLHMLIGLGVLAPLDEYLVTRTKKEPDQFVVPLDPSKITPNSAGLARGIAEGLCPVADSLFTRGTWPHTLWQQSCLLVAGHRERTMMELQNLSRDEAFGPVGHLATAQLLTYVNEHLSRAFANAGLRRLSLADFRNEYGMLLDQEDAIGECAMHAAKIIRRLDAKDIERLGTPLQTWHRSLQDPRIELKPAHARELLDLVWAAGLSEMVKKELVRLSQ